MPMGRLGHCTLLLPPTCGMFVFYVLWPGLRASFEGTCNQSTRNATTESVFTAFSRLIGLACPSQVHTVGAFRYTLRDRSVPAIYIGTPRFSGRWPSETDSYGRH